MEPVRAGLIGCGARAAGHLRAARASQVVDVLWACDQDAGRAEGLKA